MCHILVSEQGCHLLGFLRVLSGLVHSLLEIFLLNEADTLSYRGQSGEHVAEELAVDVVGVEHGALLRGGGQQADGLGDLVDGRELHALVAQGIGTTTQHIVDADAAHERVGGEVGLELTVGRTGGKVTHAHDLRIESVEGYGIEDEALGHELRVDVLVAQILADIEALLVIDVVLDLACPDTTGTCGGDVDEFGTGLDAEVNTTLGTADVHVLDFRAF